MEIRRCSATSSFVRFALAGSFDLAVFGSLSFSRARGAVKERGQLTVTIMLIVNAIVGLWDTYLRASKIDLTHGLFRQSPRYKQGRPDVLENQKNHGTPHAAAIRPSESEEQSKWQSVPCSKFFQTGGRIAADAEDLKIAFLELAKKSTSMRGTNALAMRMRDL